MCEFIFDEPKVDLQFTEANFGNILLEDFPEKKEIKNITYSFDNKGVSNHNEEVGLIQYRDATNNRLVQLGKDLLAINKLAPYTNWEEFEPLILNNLEKYINVSKQKQLNTIKLRYINKIEIKTTDLALGDYFKYSIVIPEKISKKLINFNVYSEHFYDSENDVLALRINNGAIENADIFTLIFDISYVRLKPMEYNLENIKKWISEAH